MTHQKTYKDLASFLDSDLKVGAGWKVSRWGCGVRRRWEGPNPVSTSWASACNAIADIPSPIVAPRAVGRAASPKRLRMNSRPAMPIARRPRPARRAQKASAATRRCRCRPCAGSPSRPPSPVSRAARSGPAAAQCRAACPWKIANTPTSTAASSRGTRRPLRIAPQHRGRGGDADLRARQRHAKQSEQGAES